RAGNDPEREDVEDVSQWMPLELLDAIVVAIERCGVCSLRGEDLREPSPALDAHAGGRGERGARNHRAKLDELARRDVESSQNGLFAVQVDVAANVDGMAPRAHHASRRGEARRQAPETLLPFAAPDLQVDVDDVVVGDGEPVHVVPKLEDPRLVGGAVVPDDAHTVRELRHPVRARGVETTELGAAAGAVHAAVL